MALGEAARAQRPHRLATQHCRTSFLEMLCYQQPHHRPSQSLNNQRGVSLGRVKGDHRIATAVIHRHQQPTNLDLTPDKEEIEAEVIVTAQS